MTTTFPSLVFERMAPQRKGPVFSADLAPGAHAFVVPDAWVGTSLLLCAAGLLTPYRGRVHVGGSTPQNSPLLRARMPALLPEEPALPVATTPWTQFARRRASDPTLREVLRRLLALRDHAARDLARHAAVTPEDLFLVTGLLDRRVSQLSSNEFRRVSLALALSLPSPTALLLFEPLRELDAAEAGQVLDLLSRRADAGAIVVFVVLQRRMAEHLAPNVLLVGRAPARDTHAHYVVRTPQREILARRLSAQGLDCTLDPLVSDRLHVSSPNAEELVDQLSLALAPTDESSGDNAKALSILEFYEDTPSDLTGSSRP